MKFVTSLSPHRIERQQYCLQTWMKLGLSVVAVQPPGEIEKLQEHFPWVEFVETDQTGTSVGRPHLPLISEMCNQAQSGPIILINSDISVKDTYEQFHREWMTEHDSNELVVGVRMDYKPPDGRKKQTAWGIDVFKICPSMLPLKNIGMCIGFPGWDHWLPWELHRRGYRIRVAKSALLHQTHELGYSEDDMLVSRSILLKEYNLIYASAISAFIQATTGRRPSDKDKKRKKIK